MPGHGHAFAPHAAALQCVADDVRRVGADGPAVTADFLRFAGILDHIAASLIVGEQPRG
jgi:hypothetical protein